MATREELSKSYTPAESEHVVKQQWEESGAFHMDVSEASEKNDSFAALIPPPNVTAALHLGHAFNNTLQDMTVRYHRMLGVPTMWMPGTDHAGIATQTVVEKRLLAQGVSRLELGREEFVKKTQEWKDEYEAIILDQIKVMGGSCDWERARFTMDEMCSVAVRHAFYVLFKEQLIYRGKRLVNWDPATQTALADDEVESQEVAGHMWYLQYPLEDGSGTVTVATTRPETMLGDTAVAINPTDPRAEELRGKFVRLPFVNRVIPIIEDDYVVLPDLDSSDTKAQFASGFLKVTPAHDPNDYDIGLRHDLPVINVMGPDARISREYGWEDVSSEAEQFLGLTREDARLLVVEKFKEQGLLEEVKEYSHAVGHSYRSHVPIEPWLSDQWYVAVTDGKLSGSAMRAQNKAQVSDIDGAAETFAQEGVAGDGELTFYPARYAKTFRSWHESLRDWCISRQLWWGHQIPVWFKTVGIADEGSDLGSLAGVSVEIGDSCLVESPWSAAGAVHSVRRVTETEYSETICVPPQSTLSRLDRVDVSLNEEALVAAIEEQGFVRDPDVLDTWFSSGLWPLSTMGWPWPEDFPETVGLLEACNPTSVLMTAREIMTLWVSRMTMLNRYFLDGKVPFNDVYIHAMIQDGQGQKMSKSLGNGVDPRDIIHSHGADAMRFTLAHMATETQDSRLPVDLVCPHSGETFTPEYITTSAGYVVAAPEQVSPSDPKKKMVTQYGVLSGAVEVSDSVPLARNTSSKFDAGRNFTNKVWNATRFMLSRLPEPDLSRPKQEVALSSCSFVDRWIIERLRETLVGVEEAFASYKFNVIVDLLYSFIWNDVCDRYLEAVKPTIDKNTDQQVVLGVVFDATLRMLHPVCPFVTEALWSHVQAVQQGSIEGLQLAPSELVVSAAWPEVKEIAEDADILSLFERLDSFIGEIRVLRAKHQLKPKKKVSMYVSPEVGELIAKGEGLVESLAGVESITLLDAADRPAVASPFTFEGSEVLVSGLVEALDIDAERVRLQKVIDSKVSVVKNLEGRLANKNYVEKAKPELVQQTRDELVIARKDLESAEQSLKALG